VKGEKVRTQKENSEKEEGNQDITEQFSMESPASLVWQGWGRESGSRGEIDPRI